MQAQPEPVKIGVLLDIVDGQGGSPMSPLVRAMELRFEEALEHGELDRPVQLIQRVANGLPSGSAEDVVRAFRDLADQSVLGILGPGVTDNCLVTQPLAEEHGIPTLNFPGTEHSRGVYGFQFQLGSLSDEGPMIVTELMKRGHRTVGVIRDQSPIGAEYYDYFDQACVRTGLKIASDQRVSPVANDLTAAVEQVRSSGATCLVYLGFGLVIPAMAAALASARWRRRGS